MKCLKIVQSFIHKLFGTNGSKLVFIIFCHGVHKPHHATPEPVCPPINLAVADIIVNTIIDIAYLYLDPRIRKAQGGL